MRILYIMQYARASGLGIGMPILDLTAWLDQYNVLVTMYRLHNAALRPSVLVRQDARVYVYTRRLSACECFEGWCNKHADPQARQRAGLYHDNCVRCRQQAQDALADEAKCHLATQAGLVAQKKAYAQLSARSRQDTSAAMSGALFGFPMTWSALEGDLPPRCGHGAATLTFGDQQV